MMDVFFCFETGLSATRLQMTLLGLIYQGIGVVHWVTTRGGKKKNCVAPCVSQYFSFRAVNRSQPKLSISDLFFSPSAVSEPQINSKPPPVHAAPGEYDRLTLPFSAGPCWFLILSPSTRGFGLVLNDLSTANLSAEGMRCWKTRARQWLAEAGVLLSCGWTEEKGCRIKPVTWMCATVSVVPGDFWWQHTLDFRDRSSCFDEFNFTETCFA